MGNVHAQNNIYVWYEIDPGWKTNALNFWHEVKGYGKKVPVEMSDLIENYYAVSGKKLELTLQEKILKSALPGDVVLTKNPGSAILKDHDLYMDLQCNIKEISENYPNFRIRKIQIEPVINYHILLYDSKGDLVYTKEFEDPVDYKKGIRPLLRGMPEHRRDIEIVKQSFDLSLSGNIIDRIFADITPEIQALNKKEISASPDQFRQVVGLLFENRKLSYPGAYADVDFTFNPAESVAREDQPGRAPTNTAPDTKKRIASLLDSCTYYALLIGVNDYADPNITDLSEPLNDTYKLFNTLITRYTFNPENITLLSNPTRNDLIKSLDELAARVTNKDNLLIFYAGHGLWDEQLKKGFWIPSNASTTNRTNWFSNSDLRDYIGGIQSRHTLLISDACFSGGIFKTREAFTGASPATFELYKLPSRKAMTSGAMSNVPDHSVFMEYLIKRLNENTQPFLSSEQLFASFKIAVINNSTTGQVPQFGEIRETGDEGGDFLFILKKQE